MQKRIEQNKKSIIAAAKSLVGDGGFKHAQIVAIAEMAGVSHGLVYRYFDNKSALMVQVLRDVAGHEIQILQAIAKSELAPDKKLHKAVATFVKRALNSPHTAYAFMLEPVDDIEFEKARVAIKHDIARAIETILQQGKAAGVLSVENIHTAALCIVGAMTFSVIEPFYYEYQQREGRQDADGAAIDDLNSVNPNQALSAHRTQGLDDEYRVQFSQQVADLCVNLAKTS
ncbi:hypothetical protein B0181_02380 [Moraxella caviae]|uniref:Transcriptional regulator BetI n=2 Tax=Moraxella caviae TaxID=34060 RepID=A0A1T0A8K2_9GAMM|nr:hypothetical protein B0181_02380 [Moraxella caviae]STZ09751.1 transcriptional regulator BetI [Moraxella caviae]